MNETRYTIGELAELAGITRRAVRFYVQRGLIPPPAGGGRGHYYTSAHLAGVRRIKDLQAAGYTLEAIGRRAAGPDRTPDSLLAGGAWPKPWEGLVCPQKSDREICNEPPNSGLWLRVPVAAGVELHLAAGRFRLTPARLRRLAKAVAMEIFKIISPLDEREGGNDEGDDSD